VPWREPALILAAIFFSFAFWYSVATYYPLFGPHYLLWGALTAVVTLGLTAGFFLGPAMRVRERGLFPAVADSMGRIPALAVRALSVVFLVWWIAGMLAMASRLIFLFRKPSCLESVPATWTVGAVILLFLFATGVRSQRTLAKLAMFSIKLGIAVLIAAVVRVRDGWDAVAHGFPEVIGRSVLWSFPSGGSRLAFYFAPLLFLGAAACWRLRSRGDVVRVALAGVALPLFGTLVVVSLICVAVGHTELYRPSLNPNIAMALWGDAARRTVSWRMLIALITMFGAMRFGIRALADSLMVDSLRARWRWTALCGLACAIAGIAAHQRPLDEPMICSMAVQGLAVAAAVLTADSIAGHRPAASRWIDWTGTVAFVAGFVAPLALPYRFQEFGPNDWWRPWLPPSCGIAFAACLLGRLPWGLARRTLHAP